MGKNKKKEKCCGCGACAEKCPKRAIQMHQDRDGFEYPQIDKSLCNGCGICREICLLKNDETVRNQNFYFGAQAKDEQFRYSSSSGGLFSVLARYVLRKGGIVYGAGYDGNMNVRHRGVDNQEQLEQIRKTKYVQSNMKGIYRSIEDNLDKNRWVLFCGTPCQTQALLSFLNKKYTRLIVVDLVCYGVSSPGGWRRYVKYLEHKHRGKMTDFTFRDKRNADNGHMRSFKIDKKEYVDSIYKDIYCRLYFGNYTVRPSCYQCQFCTVNRESDFTIGDFWGIERVRPDLDDGMGTSLVIAHSEKALRMWDVVKEELNWFECEKEDLLQPRLLEAINRPKARCLFLFLYRIMPFWFIERVVCK